ncbi:hypothetical protein DFH07DRAFT_774037 [Mycena maculata]|uniref:AB hydrolase-1 domain-containing protein n=1 Tax=Mycena maculata TaxID=230809 RepID=A0AAD7J2E2_9AGAR|nr:hypothetical protein DFH07DRAFT_774037 [Mycena maculata]
MDSSQEKGLILDTTPTPRQPKRRKKLAILTAVSLAIYLGFRKNPLSSPWPQKDRKIGNVKWSPASVCPPGTDCGVPKDYFDPGAGTASIAIARFRATKFPKKGTVFLNPGGLGGSGTKLASQFFADLIGEDWDLLGFDPRGINQTSIDDGTQAPGQMFRQCNGLQLPHCQHGAAAGLHCGVFVEPIGPQDRGAASGAAARIPDVEEDQAELCAKNMGDELRYMGTATVVRDTDFMAKIFDGEEGKIHYWGGSYGSILGAYLVNMLPHRTGFVVVDGIVDPVVWANEPSQKWPINWLASTEKTYRFYLEACSQAGPDACPLAEYTNEPYEDIDARLESFFDKLAVAPLPVPFAFRPGFLTSGAARDLAAEIMNTMGEVSPHFGSSVSVGEPDGGCHYWPVRGPERFTGPWNATLEWPMLIVSNTMGPEVSMSNMWYTRLRITPIESGLRVNALMPDSSRLVIQDGPGHASVTIPTLCPINLVRGYYAGTLPENGTTCETAYTFPDPKSTMDRSTVVEMDKEDRRLLENRPFQVVTRVRIPEDYVRGVAACEPAVGEPDPAYMASTHPSWTHECAIPRCKFQLVWSGFRPLINSGLQICPSPPAWSFKTGPHCYVAIPTPCTIRLVRNYFAGIPPGNGTMCDTYPFCPDPSHAELDAENSKLLKSARAVGELLHELRRVVLGGTGRMEIAAESSITFGQLFLFFTSTSKPRGWMAQAQDIERVPHSALEFPPTLGILLQQFFSLCWHGDQETVFFVELTAATRRSRGIDISRHIGFRVIRSDTAMSCTTLPRELCDFVVDYLHAERAALGTCALVCRAWVPASRFHLFEHISLAANEGHAAARLDALLASPHATFVPAVRQLDLYDALSPVQIRQPGTGRIEIKTLLELVPKISQLHHIHSLALSDLPFDILPAFSKVHTLYLVGITAGPALLRLAAYLPRLTHLTLRRVHAIPYRASSPPATAPPPPLENLRTVTVRGSSIAFLGWIGILAPCVVTLEIGDLYPSEMPYLTEYLQVLEGPLERLDLGLSPGTSACEFAWDELARALGTEARLVVRFYVLETDEAEDEDDSEGNILRSQLSELDKRGMLEVKAIVWMIGPVAS